MKDFLFDIGKVLLDFDFESSLQELLPADFGDPSHAFSKLLGKKDEFETGQISVDDYTSWALDVLGSTASADRFHHLWRNIFTPNAPMWEVVRELNDAGHRLILFSNINEIHSPWIFEKYPEFSLFHGEILSYQTGFIKPETEIYLHAIQKYSLVPENTIYIDDLPQNIATGHTMGFHCYQYRLDRHHDFKAWLTQALLA